MFQIFGTVAPPPGAAAYGGSVFGGFVPFLNNILRLIFVVGGLFAFFNLILGGFGFLSAGGDAKAIEKAWGKIWQSLVGLILIVGSFVLAAIFGYLLFGNATTILNPKLYGPTNTSSGWYQGCMTFCQSLPAAGSSNCTDWCNACANDPACIAKF